jgi:hypothetical protein
MKDVKAKFYVKLAVKNSRTCGQGLFAEEDIAIGQHILSFGGNFCLQEDRYSGKVLRSTCVGLTETINLCEECCSEKDISDYINHSCNPNAGMFDSITIIAIQPIKNGEEIFCDYAFWEGKEDWIMKSECICGSEKCRKIINGKHWKNIQQTDEYFEYYSPFLKRRIINNGNKN